MRRVLNKKTAYKVRIPKDGFKNMPIKKGRRIFIFSVLFSAEGNSLLCDLKGTKRLYVIGFVNEEGQGEPCGCLRIDLGARCRIVTEEEGFGFGLREG